MVSYTSPVLYQKQEENSLMEVSDNISDDLKTDFENFVIQFADGHDLVLLSENADRLSKIFENLFCYSNNCWKSAHLMDYMKFMKKVLKIANFEKIPEKYNIAKKKVHCAQYRITCIIESLKTIDVKSQIRSADKFKKYVKGLKNID